MTRPATTDATSGPVAAHSRPSASERFAGGLDRIPAWAGPGAVLAVAAILRLQGLGAPQDLVFDETYYVKDSWTLLNLGYEARWPEGSDAAFIAGDTDGYTAEGSFVAHPPFGKWLIAGGLAALGADDPVGWRIVTALLGVALVALTMGIAHRLLRSMFVTVAAGGLLAIDGNAIVMSRVALLDTALAVFVLLGAGAVLLDRRWARCRLERWMLRRQSAGARVDWGPALWWRPWLLAAATAFGLASSIKWSGLYYLAAFAVLSVVADAVDRRRAGIAFWGTSAALRQGPVSFVLMIPLAAAIHLTTWAGWFATSGGYYRRWVEDGGEAWTGAFAWVPAWFQDWAKYQSAMYGFHVGNDAEHSYAANPLTWLFLVRPTSMYYQDFGDGTAAAITGISNPLLWWAATAALGYCVWRVIRGERWAVFVVAGVAAGYLPWLFYLNRTVFQFYTIVFEPFLVIGLAAALGALLGGAHDPPRRRSAGLITVAGFLIAVVMLSVYWYPMWTGARIPLWFLRSHYWLPSWI